MRILLFVFGIFASVVLFSQKKGELVGVSKNLFTPDFQSKKIPKTLRPYVNSFRNIPSGSYTFGYINEESDSNQLFINQTRSLNSFYMSATEVPNWLYREFCEEMKDSLGLDSAYLFLPDTLCWLEGNSFLDNCDNLSKFYFNHPAYDNYPVVGVSQIQSKLFCKWFTEKVQKELAASSKTNLWSMGMEIRLPTEVEWEYAARGGLESLYYPWGNNIYGKDEKGNITIKANCGSVIDTNLSVIIPADFDKHLFTNHITDYQPNEYGLYNMSGNVSEWTMDAFSISEYYFIYDLNYNSGSNKNLTDTTEMILKGGSFEDSPYFLKSAVRRGVKANTQSKSIGFRVVLFYHRDYNSEY